MATSPRLQLAIERIDFARKYTLTMLDELEPEDYFCMVGDGITHIAWHLGHLAWCEYALALLRIRGRRDTDASLISPEFQERYGRGTQPNADPAANATPEEILAVLERVHQQALRELPDLTDEVLDEPLDKPHPAFNTRMGALLYCPEHEFTHSGQIGLIRRLLGKAPLR